MGEGPPASSPGVSTEGPIPTVLCFDVEPDGAVTDRAPAPWTGFERLLSRSDEWRTQLETATGRPVHFNWFLRMDPQIADGHGSAAWVAERYGERLESLRQGGDSIGVHPHAWRWAGDRWLADNGDRAWMAHCTRVSFASYEAAFGGPPSAVRFGDRQVGADVLRLAAELGARYDLSVEPGMPSRRTMTRLASTGRIPANVDAPRQPYRPAVDAPFRRAAPGQPDAGLWMVPLTSIDWRPLLPFWRRVRRRLRHPLGPGHRLAYLVLPADPIAFWRLVEADVDAAVYRHLAFAIRSDAVVKPDEGPPLDQKLRALLRLPLVRRLSFTTPDVVVSRSTA